MTAEARVLVKIGTRATGSKHIDIDRIGSFSVAAEYPRGPVPRVLIAQLDEDGNDDDERRRFVLGLAEARELARLLTDAAGGPDPA